MWLDDIFYTLQFKFPNLRTSSLYKWNSPSMLAYDTAS